MNYIFADGRFSVETLIKSIKVHSNKIQYITEIKYCKIFQLSCVKFDVNVFKKLLEGKIDMIDVKTLLISYLRQIEDDNMKNKELIHENVKQRTELAKLIDGLKSCLLQYHKVTL